MTTASERVLTSMEIVIAESEKNLLRLKQIESLTLALEEGNRELAKALNGLEKRLTQLNTDSVALKNRALKLIVEHLESDKKQLQPF